jgi:hypothetical protein
MKVEIGTVAAQLLFWEYFFRIFVIVSLLAVRSWGGWQWQEENLGFYGFTIQYIHSLQPITSNTGQNKESNSAFFVTSSSN